MSLPTKPIGTGRRAVLLCLLAGFLLLLASFRLKALSGEHVSLSTEADKRSESSLRVIPYGTRTQQKKTKPAALLCSESHDSGVSVSSLLRKEQLLQRQATITWDVSNHEFCIPQPRLHCLPKLVLFGVPTAATTSLFGWLQRHPNIVAATKEVFFHPKVHKQQTTVEYAKAAGFPVIRPDELTVDFSPQYLYYYDVPQMLVNLLPSSSKLIVILREPLQHAISYAFFKRLASSMADFLEVTKDELVLFESGYKTQPDFLPMKAPRTSKHVAARILQESMYSTFLERWIHIFGCQRILVLDFQLVTQDPQLALDKIYSFVGLKQHDIDHSFLHHKFGHSCLRNATTVPPIPHDVLADSDIQRYQRIFYPFNKELRGLCGGRFSQLSWLAVS